jgi:hypothetical protein
VSATAQVAVARPPVVRVAVDAEGGDRAPEAVVQGCLAAASEHLQVLLVGRGGVMRRLVAGAAHVEVVDAPDVIGGGDEAARSVRAKPQASMVVAARLVAEGRADAVFSAGNTGAFVAAALLTLLDLRGGGVLRGDVAGPVGGIGDGRSSEVFHREGPDATGVGSWHDAATAAGGQCGDER